MLLLGIKPSHSRPRVSNDNAHAEALFRTAKYHPSLPPNGFASLDTARQWAGDFVLWYNTEHQHSALNYITPDKKHHGDDIQILADRNTLYEKFRKKFPERWIQNKTRNWSPTSFTHLNPLDDRDLEKHHKKSI